MSQHTVTIHKNNSLVAFVDLQQLEGEVVVNKIIAYHCRYKPQFGLAGSHCVFFGPIKARWPEDSEDLLRACHIGHDADKIVVSEEFYDAMRRHPEQHPALAKFASYFGLEAHWPCCMAAEIDNVSIMLTPISTTTLMVDINICRESINEDVDADEDVISSVSGPMSPDDAAFFVKFMLEKPGFLRLRASWDEEDCKYYAEIFSVDYVWVNPRLHPVKKFSVEAKLDSASELKALVELVKPA